MPLVYGIRTVSTIPTDLHIEIRSLATGEVCTAGARGTRLMYVPSKTGAVLHVKRRPLPVMLALNFSIDAK